MEREIKFKAKSLADGGWVEGDLCHRITDTCIAVKDMDDIVYYPVDPSTVCQYTGLKDAKGQEIWEHDLVKGHEDSNIEVVFSKGAFMMCSKSKYRHLIKNPLCFL